VASPRERGCAKPSVRRARQKSSSAPASLWPIQKTQALPRCTCYGRSSAGLAAVDVALDDTFRGRRGSHDERICRLFRHGRNNAVIKITPGCHCRVSSQQRARLMDIKVAPAPNHMAKQR
jgi:hypothetical protein